MRRAGLALAALALTLAPARADDRAIFAAMVDEFIRPGYELLVAEAGGMRGAMEALCAAPAPATFDIARKKFADLVTAWSRIEIVRFGPVVAENRLERIFFWPDPRGIGLRQVQAVLAEEDPTALAVETLRQKSVALQGLGALEFVLFGTGSEVLAEAAGFRCPYGTAIAGAIESAASATLAEWRDPAGIAARLLAPDENYFDYRSDAEVMSELVGIFVHGTELIRDTRLVPFVAPPSGNPNPRAAPLWRSRLTLVSAAAAVAAMRDLFVRSGIAAAIETGAPFAAGAFEFEAANFAATVARISPDLEAALADPAMKSRLDYLVILTRSLQDIVVNQVAVALGVSAGFSALDGD